MSSNVSISTVITQTSNIQSSNVSTTTFDSISTTTNSITTTTTTTTTTTNTPITTTTTNISFFTDINSTVSTSNDSQDIPRTLSGNVPSVTTLTPKESINESINESVNTIIIVWSLFGSILFSVFLCMFINYCIRRKKRKKKKNIVVYNPRGVNGLLNGSSYNGSSYNGIQQTRLNVQPRSDSLKQFNSQYNNSSRYSGDIVELVEITNCNNEIQNMYNNIVQTNLYENNTNEEIKFAETMGKQDNQEMLMYYRAGWVTAVDHVIEMLKNSSFIENLNHIDDIEND